MFLAFRSPRVLLSAGVSLGALLQVPGAAAQEPAYSSATVFENTQSAGATPLTTLAGQAVVFRDQATREAAPIVNDGGSTIFLDASSAGIDSGSITANGGGTVYFGGQATAADARIVANDGGTIRFEGDSTAGRAFVTNNDLLAFHERSRLGAATITNNGAGTLTLSGQASGGNAGIANNGALILTGDADAAASRIVNNGTGSIDFSDRSTAGSSAITNNGTLGFAGDSTLGDATLTVNATGVTSFTDRASAGTASITNDHLLRFDGDSTAANAAIVGNASSTIIFASRSSAADAEIDNAGLLTFGDEATAGTARIGLRPDAVAVFSGRSSGGNAEIQIDDGAALDISGVAEGGLGLGAIRGAGSVYLGGKLLELTTNEAFIDFDGRISDGGASGGTGGGLVKAGTGILTLSGTSDYTGRSIVRGGTLKAGGEGAFAGRSAFDVEAGGTLALSGFAQTIGSLEGAGLVDLEGGTLTVGANDRSTLFGGRIEGDGSLVKIGAGTLELAGENDYRGDTLVSAGTLSGSSRSIKGSIANAGTVVLTEDSAATLTGTIGGLGGEAGEMVKRGAGQLTLAGRSDLDWTIEAGGVTSASDRFFGDLRIDAGANFTFDQTYDGVYAGALSGPGVLLFAGGGIVRLSGDNSSFAGVTTVDGVLSVNGTLGGSVTVASGGILKGNGTIGTTRLDAGATIAPGNSIGAIAVDGDLTYAAGSTYAVEIGAGGEADRIDVRGTATLGGAGVDIVALDPTVSYRDGQTYTILTASDVVGRFGALSIDSAFLRSTLLYASDRVLLGLRTGEGAASFASAATTRNGRETAGALDGLDQAAGSASLSLYNALLFSNASEARRAFDELSGEIHASVKTDLVEEAGFLRRAALDRLASTFESDETRGAWIAGYRSSGRNAAGSGVASFDRDLGGVLIGGDGFVGDDLRLGFLGGYSRGSVDLDGRDASAEIDGLHAGLYAGLDLGRIQLKAGAGYSWNEVDTTRSVVFGGFSDRLEAGYDSGAAQVFGEASYAIDLAPGIRLDPFAQLAYVHLDTEGFGETGGAAALRGQSQTEGETISTLGLRAAGEIDIGGLTLTAHGLAGWRHAFGDPTPTTDLAFATSDTFSIEGAPLTKDAALLELGLGFAVTSASKLGVTYSGQFGSDASENRVDLQFGLSF
ncbi:MULTISPECIES: autotransporter domain-containing protein [unclassified Aureimonas]|uniref:autotransporter domain-containing protein n=1 Tax=unclassified Aureimonas TaxID=2615206 RepID=UPI000701374B|nr:MULTISPECIES: autotransporter domain-containing protein [unclassified Aureimonas]KQT64008.1 hypothetical protein ASG62_03040 [Aureimonas sp. Leaf427]KQT81201.1 hypothetical protein ASG54_00310 [Aureimonas sp. Leaf460]